MNVIIKEVGPRDGLQNEQKILSAENRIEFINKLTACHLRAIEIGSFVSPEWVPQMANSFEVAHHFSHSTKVHYSALVPNLKGLEGFLRSGLKEIAVFTAASETFSRKNTNLSLVESLAVIKDIIAQAKSHSIRVRGYLSCVMGCPYEGEIAVKSVTHMTEKLLEFGCYEVSLGDTIGVGTPHQTRHLIKSVLQHCSKDQLAIHCHNTYGQALANILMCLEEGISVIDASVAGLGGCPYAKGATGNVATEDVIYLCEGLGYHTGVDLPQLVQVGDWICKLLSRTNESKVAAAMLAKLKH